MSKICETGDRGQRYEVTFLDFDRNRLVFGWADSGEGVNKMLSSIEKHPIWSKPIVFDRDA